MRDLLWDQLETALTGLYGLARLLFDPQSFLYYPYALAFVALGWLTLAWRFGPRGALAGLFPRAIYLHRSAAHDLLLYALNRLLLALLWLPRLTFAFALALSISAALTSTFGPVARPHTSALAVAGFTLLDALLGDFALFALHLLSHRFGLLWAFHKVHHSAPVLTPITGQRFHPLEVAQDRALMGSAVPSSSARVTTCRAVCWPPIPCCRSTPSTSPGTRPAPTCDTATSG